ncbi:MAG TPA: hypothetical protein VGJ20_05345 [Xanthobacteraceae bacterium]
MHRVLGLLASALIVGGIIAACRPTGDVGYVEIKTVPVAPVTQTALYFDSTRLAPIREGSAVLRQRVGTLRLQAQVFSGALAPLCNIVVQKNRITTVTVSVLERPPRCQCRFTGGSSAGHTCVS